MKGKMRKKFICPACKAWIGASVIDAKPIHSGFRRYRQCDECGIVFVTMEKIDHISRGSRNERQAGG